MLISICNGKQLFETRDCTLVCLPDGREGAIWRGLAYPLVLPDRHIDMGSDAFPPGDCVHQDAYASPPQQAFAIIEGVEEAYVLLPGSNLLCESTARALKDSGYEVLRTGRYLGDPVDSLEADWFIRLAIANELGSPSTLLTQILEGQRGGVQGNDIFGDYRARLIATELASVKAREAALRAEVALLRLERTNAGQTQAEIEELKAAIELERSLRQEADLAAFAASQLAAESRADRPATAPGKLKNELEAVFETLLPGIRLMRDSLIVIAAEFSNRKALYRGLAELRIVSGRVPQTWKKLKGLDAWWERHISDGQDDSGRIYTRFGASDQAWDVLISYKSEQARDIAWLARQ